MYLLPEGRSFTASPRTPNTLVIIEHDQVDPALPGQLVELLRPDLLAAPHLPPYRRRDLEVPVARDEAAALHLERARRPSPRGSGVYRSRAASRCTQTWARGRCNSRSGPPRLERHQYPAYPLGLVQRDREGGDVHGFLGEHLRGS